MGFKESAHVHRLDTGPISKDPSNNLSYTTVANMQRVVWSHVAFSAAELESSSHKPTSAVSVVMISVSSS